MRIYQFVLVLGLIGASALESTVLAHGAESEAGASAQAMTESDVEHYPIDEYSSPEDYEQAFHDGGEYYEPDHEHMVPDAAYNGEVELSPEEQINKLRIALVREFNRYPEFYDPTDINNILQGNNWHTERFLHQRSYHLRSAIHLAIDTLRWRRSIGLHQLTAEQFPCDLFHQGLIFQHGYSRELTDKHGKFYPSMPVIYLRTGALGEVIEEYSRFTPRRAASNLVRLTSTSFGTSKKFLNNIRNRPNVPSPEIVLKETGAAARNPSFHTLLSAIAWWIHGWELRNAGPAMLVLDFENDNRVFKSISVAKFISKLDDHFPGLFGKIMSSLETDQKLNSIKTIDELAAHMLGEANQDVVPGYMGGTCKEHYEAPDGCVSFTEYSTIVDFDIRLMELVRHVMLQRCRPKRPGSRSSGFKRSGSKLSRRLGY